MLIHVGKTGRPHGVGGGLRVWPLEGSSGAWAEAEFVYIGRRAKEAVRYRLLGCKRAGKACVVELEGVSNRDGAARLSNMNLYVERSELPACEDGTYYLEDLRRLVVVDLAGQKIGRLIDAFDTGAHEVYVVETKNGEIMLPVVQGVVERIDLAAGVMVVNPPEGLPGLDRRQPGERKG